MSTEHTLSNTAPPWHGVFTANGDGQFLYQSDAYRVAFDRTGRLLSLRVNGHEFLSVDGTELAGGCFVADGLPVGLPHINLQADTAALVNGHAGIFLQATPDRLQLDLGHENPLGYQDLVVFPADDVVITPLEHAVMREQRRLPAYTRFQCAESAMRWTAPDGTAIEWQYAAAIVPDYHGRRAMIISVPFGSRLCGEIRFPASVWAADAVDITLTVGAPDHCFAAGAPIAVQGTVARKAETATVIELTLRISDLNTDECVLEVPLLTAAVQTSSLPFSFHQEWHRPGPWRLEVIAVDDTHILGIKHAVMVYDLEHYLPPLYRQDDFWTFWEEALARQRAVPLEASLAPWPAEDTAEARAFEVFITGYQGRRLRGIYREPIAPGRYPVAFGGDPGLRTPCCVLTQTTMDGQATFRSGLWSRETANFFYCALDSLRWVDFLASRKKVDLERSVCITGSRGGPIGLAVLALDPRMKMYIANMPTNNRWDWQVTYPAAWGWGPNASDQPAGMTREDYIRLLSYFDPSHFAERVTQPVLINLGLLDDLSQVSGNLACFVRLASTRKDLQLLPWGGHDAASPEWHALADRWVRELFGATTAQ